MAGKKLYKIDTGDVRISDLGQEAEDAWNSMTEKAKAVVAAYCRTGSSSKAYMEGAGYEGSAQNAGHMARKILRLPKAVLVIDAWRKASADRFGITEDKILRAYGHLAFADIRDFFDENGNLIDIKKLPRECADMIAGFDVEELWAGQGKDRVQIGVTKKIRLINRKDALDSLARTQGLFVQEPKTKRPEAKIVKMPEKPQTAKEWHAKNAPKQLPN